MASNRTIGTGIQLKNIVHFRSIGRVGTGATETIPHGLGVTPAYVGCQARDSSQSVVIGAGGVTSGVPADHTNIYVTVANTVPYDLIAIPSGE